MIARADTARRSSLILVVDDELADRQLLDVMLTAEGFLVLTAGSGREALAMIARQPPDLILLDVMMPDMDGYQVAEQLNAARGAVPIPIIMITVLDERDVMMRALAVGAQDFLTKPVNRLELCMRVRNHLRLKEYADYQRKYSQMLEHEVQEQVRKSVALLTASEHRYRTLMESANDAIALLTMDGVVREMNHRWAEIAGVAREQLIGRHARDFWPSGDLTAPMSAPIKIGKADGSSLVMEFSHAAVDVAGEHLVLTIGRDVTEQRQLEEQLRQAQKMEVVGQLAGGIAHDFNNILTAILGFAELLLTDLPAEHAGRTDVFEIKAAGERAAGLTHQLLAFSRKQILQSNVLDINGVIVGMEPMLRRLIAAHIELVLFLHPAVGAIKIDPTQLEQIVINLLVNAADAMPRGGKLTIETANVRLDENYIKHHLPIAPGDYVMLAVSDTGVGMDATISGRVFEPFFTTKEVGKGTGLGLSTVYGIVKQSGGDIWVYSEPGHGAVFKIYLPEVGGVTSAVVKAVAAQGSVRRGSETVLLVEDDEAVRRLARLILERAGYRVVEAANPKEGLRVANDCHGVIDLLLSDLFMPESDGLPLIERLSKVRPGVRVLYMSGYADEAVVRQGMIAEGTPFLQKPFTPIALTSKVRDVLDSPRFLTVSAAPFVPQRAE
ncbi:MAG TPA: response regulator [Polyangia bacterium]|nr:response regulator [Polyangia bacterium]